MKCQVCSTQDPTKFGASILICEQCLFKKQMATYAMAQIKLANDYLKKALDDALMYGAPEPMGLFTTPVSCTNCGKPTNHASKLCESCRAFTGKQLLSGLTLPSGLDPEEVSMIFGIPISYLQKSQTEYASSMSEPLTVENLMEVIAQLKQQKTTWTPLQDAQARDHTIDRQIEMFCWMMNRPIRLDLDYVHFLCDAHFGNTIPLTDNATLPLPI